MLLSWKLKGGEEKWTTSDDLRLIECFNEDEELEDEEDIDWERLAADWPRYDNHSNQKQLNSSHYVSFNFCVLFMQC